MYDARMISNWFVRKATLDQKTIDLVKLLQLSYLAHGWHLEITRRPLISSTIEAWSSGPITPVIYKSFKDQGVAVKTADHRFPFSVGTRVDGFLEEIFSLYGSLTSHQLRRYTCSLNGPWHTTLTISGLYMPIPNPIIYSDFSARRAIKKRNTHTVTEISAPW